MNHCIAIIKKELKMYFNSPLGYIFLVAFLAVSSWLFMQGYFVAGEASMRSFFSLLPWIFLFIIPAVTMRLWAEEKKQGTIEILMTLPVRDSEVVLGKFLASLAFLGIALACSLPLAIIVIISGNADIGIIIASYIGTLLLSAAYLSIGLWISSLTSNQIVAFIGAVTLTFILVMIGHDAIIGSLPQSIGGAIKYMSLNVHFASIARGVLDTRDILYYLSVVTLFLCLNMYSMANRK